MPQNNLTDKSLRPRRGQGRVDIDIVRGRVMPTLYITLEDVSITSSSDIRAGISQYFGGPRLVSLAIGNPVVTDGNTRFAINIGASTSNSIPTYTQVGVPDEMVWDLETGSTTSPVTRVFGKATITGRSYS